MTAAGGNERDMRRSLCGETMMDGAQSTAPSPNPRTAGPMNQESDSPQPPTGPIFVLNTEERQQQTAVAVVVALCAPGLLFFVRGVSSSGGVRLVIRYSEDGGWLLRRVCFPVMAAIGRLSGAYSTVDSMYAVLLAMLDSEP